MKNYKELLDSALEEGKAEKARREKEEKIQREKAYRLKMKEDEKKVKECRKRVSALSQEFFNLIREATVLGGSSVRWYCGASRQHFYTNDSKKIKGMDKLHELFHYGHILSKSIQEEFKDLIFCNFVEQRDFVNSPDVDEDTSYFIITWGASCVFPIIPLISKINQYTLKGK